MRPRRRRSSLVALLAASLAAACGDGVTAPVLPPGGGLVARYALATANGRGLPVTLWTEPSGASAALVADTLILEAGGRVERRRVLRFTTATGAMHDETARFEEEYQRRGTTIEIGSLTPCPPNANCVANDVGALVAGRILLESRHYPVGNQPSSLVYERLP